MNILCNNILKTHESTIRKSSKSILYECSEIYLDLTQRYFKMDERRFGLFESQLDLLFLFINFL